MILHTSLHHQIMKEVEATPQAELSTPEIDDIDIDIMDINIYVVVI